MGVTVAQLIANVSVTGADKAKSDLQGVQANVGSAGGAIASALGGAALAAGAAVVGIGVASVKMAADFQTGMTSLVTGAGESRANLKGVSDGILNIATQTGTSTKQLTDGMYMIESAGFHGKAGLDVLTAAAEGAKVGNADLGTVAGAVTTLMHDYSKSNYSATQATNALITTVASGKTKMQDLSGSLSAVLPLAASLHVPFEQVAGAIATMTNSGTSAQQASQNLGNALRSLNVESSKGSKALDGIGLSAKTIHDDLMNKGLPETLQIIEDHIGKKMPLSSLAGQQALKDIMGGATGLNVALKIGGDHMKEFEGDVSSIGDSLRSSSKDVQGWADVQGTFNFQLDRAKEMVETLGIRIGTALLPYVTKIADAIMTQAGPALENFSKFLQSPAFQQFATGVGKQIADTFSNIGSFIKQNVVPQIVAFQNYLKSKDFQTFLDQMKFLGQQLSGVIGPAFSNMKGPASAVFDNIVPAIKALFGMIGTVAKGFGDLVKFFKDGSGPAQVLEAALGGIATAMVAIKIGQFVAGIPALVAGFLTWGAAAWTAAAGTIAATWPLLAIGAAIAIVVAGIIIAVQHWGDITKFLGGVWHDALQGIIDMLNALGIHVGKTSTQVALESAKQKDAVLKNTEETNRKSIDNYEKMRVGILDRLSSCKDDATRISLEQQLKVVNAHLQTKEQALAHTEELRRQNTEKMTKLKDEAAEQSKGLVQHVGDFFGQLWKNVQGIFGNVGKWFHDRFTDAYNGIVGVFSPVGKWFGDRWNDVTKVLSPVTTFFSQVFQTSWNIIVRIFQITGKWFQDRFSEAWTNITNIFSGIGRWFNDRWNDVVRFLTPVGNWFRSKFAEAWSNVVTVFQGIGKWFHDRWTEVTTFLAPIGNWFRDRFREAWNNVVAIFTPIGRWFGDRWNDVINGVIKFKNDIIARVTDVENGVVGIFRNMINGIVNMLNNGISAVESFVNFFGQGLDNLAKALGTTGTIQVVHLGRIPHYESGTGEHPGGPAIVGERGRELVFLPRGASVVPNDMTEKLLGNVPGYAGGAGDWVSKVEGWISGGAQAVMDNMVKALGLVAPKIGNLTSIASGVFSSVEKWSLGWINSLLSKVGASTGGGSAGPGHAVNVPGNVASWIQAAIALTGVPGNWLNDLEIIAMHESGGNPSAINNWDSNALAGHPSQGLMQTIPGTFAAHMVAGHGNILNPIDNAAAAINYIKAAYGTVFNVPGIRSMASGGAYQGYADGTNFAPGGLSLVGERGPEAMYIPRGAQIIPNGALNRPPQSPQIIVNPPAIYLDGREIANNQLPYLVNAIRYNTGTHGI